MHDSAQALRGKKLLLVGFTLFSMFFGAGNLIFPPFLGAQAGTALWPAFVGFAVSAIGLPIAGVAAVARAGGLPALAGRVHPRFAQVFAVLVYLSIGPCLAIPRTASTSFEMLTPLVGRSTPGQFLYSLVFFAAAYFVALKPEKLTQRLDEKVLETLERWAASSALPCWCSSWCCSRAASSARPRPATARLPRLTPPSPPHRAYWTAIRPWTRWQRSISARSSR